MSQLAFLLWDFVLFKSKLELQESQHVFAMMPPGTPFNEEEMISFTGESGPDTLVDYTISPALIKISAEGSQTCLFKARVKTFQASRPSISPEVDSVMGMNMDWDVAEGTEHKEHSMKGR